MHILQDLVEVLVYIDATFSINSDKFSRLEIIALLPNKKDGTVDIIHYTTTKSKLVCKSVLAAELFTFVDGYDIGFSIAYSFMELSNRKASLAMYTDAQSLFGLCIS